MGAGSHYDGSMTTLAEMVRRAAHIIRRADPDAKVACPSFGRLCEPEGRALLAEFVRSGACEFCERVWNTGPGAEIDDGAKLSDRRANDYAVRFFLVGLYIHKSNVDRMYFYSWGSRNIPLVVQLVGGRPTEAGRRTGRLHGWLADTRVSSCGKGRGMGLPDGVFECVFQRGPVREPEAAGPWLAIRWTQRGRASGWLGEGAHLLRRMDGSSERVRAGERVEYGETPVLVEYRA